LWELWKTSSERVERGAVGLQDCAWGPGGHDFRNVPDFKRVFGIQLAESCTVEDCQPRRWLSARGNVLHVATQPK
jgi:hypothetical protein